VYSSQGLQAPGTLPQKWEFPRRIATVGLREATVRPGVVNGVVMTAPGVNEEQAVFLVFF